jgi:hypothetical protein
MQNAAPQAYADLIYIAALADSLGQFTAGFLSPGTLTALASIDLTPNEKGYRLKWPAISVIDYRALTSLCIWRLHSQLSDLSLRSFNLALRSLESKHSRMARLRQIEACRRQFLATLNIQFIEISSSLFNA